MNRMKQVKAIKRAIDKASTEEEVLKLIKRADRLEKKLWEECKNSEETDREIATIRPYAMERMVSIRQERRAKMGIRLEMLEDQVMSERRKKSGYDIEVSLLKYQR